VLGNPKLAQEHKRQRAQSKKHAAQVGPVIRKLIEEGLPQRVIIEKLNRDGVPAPRGGMWWPRTLTRFLAAHMR
jgi:hypothetical protein